MRGFRKISLWLTGPTVIAGISILIFFQNCGKAGFESAQKDVQLSVGTVSPESAGAPFAFDASFDQISYMSCFGNQAAGKPGFYSVRAGGYTARGGMKVNQAFTDYAKTIVKPIYPAQTASIEQIKKFLSETPTNSGTAPQIAIRLRNDLTTVQAVGSATLGVDFVNVTTEASDDRIMDTVIRAPASAYANYFPLSDASSRNFESKLTYNTDESLTGVVRYNLSLYSTMALTFSKEMSSSLPRSPTADTAKAYGRGYQLAFAQAPGTYIYSPANRLSGVAEVDLQTGSQMQSEAWSCPDTLRLKIVRPADRMARCPMTDVPDRVLTDSAYRQRLEIVRRHLKAEYWDVSLDNGCAVPKDGDCYPSDGNNNGPFPVAYDAGAACFSKAVTLPPNTQAVTPWCVQYVSFCIK